MSHLIIKPYDVVYTPRFGEFSETWHKLNEFPTIGDTINGDGSNVERVFRPIHETGFKPDFEAEISTLPADLVSELEENPLTGWKVLLADQRADGNGIFPLHVCKKGYAIHQNRKLFDAMIAAAKEVLGDANFEIATVGTLGAFSQFFVSLAIKGGQSSFQVGKGDTYSLFFNLVSSHNSLVASQILLSAIRIVCMNTVQFSINDAEKGGTTSKFKHSKNSDELITSEQFAKNLTRWTEEKDKLQKLLKAIAAVPMNADGFRSFASGIFTREDSDELSTTSRNRVEDLATLFQKGRGNRGVNLGDGVNAFTEYFTSGRGVGGKDVKASKRIASANFGRGNEWKLEALRVAADEKELVATMKRGERLYAEYSQN